MFFTKKSNAKQEELLRGWKIISSYLNRYRKEMILLSILGLLSALANGLTPFLMGRFFDAIIHPSLLFSGAAFQMPSWMLLLGLWFIVQGGANTADWIISNKSQYIGVTLQGVYLSENISRILYFPVSFYKNQKTGKLNDAIGRAGWQINSMLGDVLIGLAPQFLSIVVGLIITFYISVFAGTLLIIGIFVYMLLLARILPESVKIRKAGNEAWGRAYDDAYQAISNVHAIKQATAEKYEERNLKKKFVTIASYSWYKIEKIWSSVNFSQRILITSVQVLIFAYSVFEIQSGRMSLGDLVALSGYSAMVFSPFTALGRSWQVIQGGLTDVVRVEKMLDQQPEIYIPKNAVILDQLKGGIEFKDVEFSYKRGQKVLSGVNFKVEPGEVVALVGESGVGKSTLVELLSGYYFANSGKVFIDGHNIKELDLTFLRGNIGIVPQEVVLFNDTVKNNIRYGKFGASTAEVIHATNEARAHDFIEKFQKKYEQVVGERGIRLSVGQKQRISIARAILRNPKILILDEPTSALDPATEKQITESLEKLMKGRTTFIIAHRLSTVRKADKIFVLENGTIKEAGSHDELIKLENGAYRKLYELNLGLG